MGGESVNLKYNSHLSTSSPDPKSATRNQARPPEIPCSAVDLREREGPGINLALIVSQMVTFRVILRSQKGNRAADHNRLAV